VFTTEDDTNVLDAEMAMPLPRMNGRYTLVPEAYAKVEYDDFASTGYFVGLPFTDEATQLTQITLGMRSGVSGQMFGKASRGSGDLGLVFGHRDTDGVATDYSFVKLALAQEVFLNPKSSVALRFTGQTSGDDLHPLAQLALGGDSTVRGYDVDGVSGSTAMAASVEYRASGVDFSFGGQDAKFNPHVFVDYGFAKAEAPFDDAVMLSVGFGGQFQVGNNVVGTLDIANPFIDAGTTEAGATNVAFQLTMRF
jgi:hemolysin activation/secretion protein